MKVHSYHSPSSAGRWLACPASVRLHKAAEQMGLLDDTTSRYAERGTFAMRVLELMLQHRLSLAAAETEAAKHLSVPDEYGAEDREAILAAFTYMSSLAARAERWGVEEAVDIIPEMNVWGTCDFWAEIGTTLHIVDYKHGAGIPVAAEGNPQLLLYAYGFLANTSKYTQVSLTIFQPRAQKKNTIDTVVYPCQKVKEFGDYVQETILFDKSPPRTGDHCRYCPAVLVCPARANELRRLAEMTDPDLADPINLRFAIAAEKRVMELIEKAKKIALKRLQMGADIPGLTLVEGPGRLTWKDGAIEALREKFGDMAFETTAMSPARVRDNLSGGEEFVAQWADKKPGYKTVRAVDGQPNEE